MPAKRIPHASGRGRGRPPKLDAAKVKIILEAIRRGMPKRDAASLAAIHVDTINEWLNRGSREKAGIYHEFSASFQQAESAFVQNNLILIQGAATEKRHWQAAAWLLEKKRPEEFRSQGEARTHRPGWRADPDANRQPDNPGGRGARCRVPGNDAQIFRCDLERGTRGGGTRTRG